ncbi:MAG TPA: bifunctional alpha/beta hydrolase/class I SAM-dependent methyltransferase [Pseudomonadales bacterium]|nr:bifunctional alpha/beta hydrolase/class I SAM-dependent methyltransferase [Pseudomonadales bacterium]
MQTIEQTFETWDGARLFYRAWQPSKPANKALVLFHRGHEHSGRWQETVEKLALDDVAVFAWDARGHGKSPGERGSAENLGVVIRDMEAFVRHVSVQYGIPVENMVVLAHSVGAVTAVAWVHDFAPPIRGLILGVPAFRVKLYVPLAVPLLRLKQKLFGHGYVKSYVKAKMLTHDAEQAAAYQADPMIFRQIAVNILLDLHDTSTRLIADAGAIHVPTLMFVAGSDWVVKTEAQQKFFDGLSSPVKRIETLPGFYHAIFHEKDRALLISKTREFILECFSRPPQAPSLLDADKRGFTKDEYDRLCQPGNPVFNLVRFGLKTLGRMSHGIQLGWEAGFDSGRTLDYVYENKPRGHTPLGRAFDSSYLNSIGWRGIRVRKLNLQNVLRDAIERTHREGRPVRLLDIASGPGRYVLETIRDHAQIPITALLRDYKMENVEAARQLAEELKLKNVTVMQGDAFDRASLAAVNPGPTIGIVSGLYELFPANEPLVNSLRGLADAIEPGGYLVYTNQPWHPQVEFIARVLTNREGKPWIMRRRTQAEMDELVRAAGFEKLREEIDQWGIFSVSLARRIK